jgi:hypothetical protein
LECYKAGPVKLRENYYLTGNIIQGCRDGIFNVELKEWKIPLQILDAITPERVETYIDIIDSNVYADKKFGSIYEWCLMTDLYELPHFSAMTGLLVNIGIIRNGMVASIVVDDHGRSAINIIYNTLDEYLLEYNQWLKMDHDKKQYAEKVDDHGRSAINIIYNTLDEYLLEYNQWLKMDHDKKQYAEKVYNDLKDEYEESDMALACEEFSGYIRNKLKLDMYYG